jgi:hypothetical protein
MFRMPGGAIPPHQLREDQDRVVLRSHLVEALAERARRRTRIEPLRAGPDFHTNGVMPGRAQPPKIADILGPADSEVG